LLLPRAEFPPAEQPQADIFYIVKRGLT
jgi:hypothetical protein